MRFDVRPTLFRVASSDSVERRRSRPLSLRQEALYLLASLDFSDLYFERRLLLLRLPGEPLAVRIGARRTLLVLARQLDQHQALSRVLWLSDRLLDLEHLGHAGLERLLLRGRSGEPLAVGIRARRALLVLAR